MMDGRGTTEAGHRPSQDPDSLSVAVVALPQGEPGAGRLQFNPEPLSVVERRDNVTAVAAIRGRSRADRLRVWLALGGTEDDFPESYKEASSATTDDVRLIRKAVESSWLGVWERRSALAALDRLAAGVQAGRPPGTPGRSKCVCTPPFFEADCRAVGHCLAPGGSSSLSSSE